jgi:hypothetical protein
MFRWIIERPTTFYGFLSGMFMSVATTALSNFALVADTPSNLGKLIKSAALAFMAAAGWFLMSEFVGSIKDRIRKNQEGLEGSEAETYQKAAGIVAKVSAAKLYALLLSTVACSVLWPFI